MADATSDAKKTKQVLQERRLAALGQALKPLPLGLGFLGAGALGAGTYGRWISQTPAGSASALLLVGAGCTAYFAWQLSREGAVVCVGDAGVAIERAGELQRLLWCDMNRIHVDQDHLVLTGTGPELSIAEASHALAMSWILKEAAERLRSSSTLLPALPTGCPSQTQQTAFWAQSSLCKQPGAAAPRAKR